MTAKIVQKALRRLADPVIAAQSFRYMKTGRGEYAEGDKCLGIRTPVMRTLLKEFYDLPIKDALTLLGSKYHEERWFALQLLERKFRTGTADEKETIYDQYLGRTEYINNWDLVDCSAPGIVGSYLKNRSRRPLYKLAKSRSLWERRIAIMSTFHFIRDNDFDDAFGISKMLLNDKEDLIHKAAGWMLREVGNRDRTAEKKFLNKHYRAMPRTMLRYAIEKFPEKERKSYLRGDI